MGIVDAIGAQVLREVPRLAAMGDAAADRLEDPLRIDRQRGADDGFRGELMFVAEAYQDDSGIVICLPGKHGAGVDVLVAADGHLGRLAMERL